MIATTHLLSIERSQIQFIGVRGQWVISAYPQITRFLGARLSQDHALLFAEPVVAAHTIDWFTAADGEAQPFTRMNEASRVALLQQIRTLITDIQALSQELSASAQSDQQLIGEMLKSILTFPDQSLFLVGAQPVVAGWGLKFAETDIRWRAASILHAKTAREAESARPAAGSGLKKGQPRIDSPAPLMARPRPAPSLSAHAAHTADATHHLADADTPAFAQSAIATGVTASSLWSQRWWIGLFVLLALALLIVSLSSINEIAFQWDDATPAVSKTRPAQAAASEPLDPLAATRQREYQLRQELARLQAELLGKRRSCAAR